MLHSSSLLGTQDHEDFLLNVINMSRKPELEEPFLEERLENRNSVIPSNAIFFTNPEEMLYPWANNPYFFYIIATYIITFVIGVTGNIIVIAVMIGDRTSRNVTNIFLVSLAVADLLLLVICAPLDVTHYLVMQWDEEGTVCKIAAYAEQLSASASILNLVAVTLERFVVIVFPIKSRSFCTMNNFKKLMIGVWVVSLLLATPSAAIKNTVEATYYNENVTVTLFFCEDLKDWRGLAVAEYRFVTLFALPLVLMIVCYSWVIVELWMSTKSMSELTHQICDSQSDRVDSRVKQETSSSAAQPRRMILRSHVSHDGRDAKRARQQVIKMLILVVILFLVCWGPRLLMEIILKCCLIEYNVPIYIVRVVFYLLPFVHSCLNPIVYCFMSTKFRLRMLHSLEHHCSCCCKCLLRKRTKHQRIKLRSFLRRNGTKRHGSTYIFTSYVQSATGSPSVELTQNRSCELETVNL